MSVQPILRFFKPLETWLKQKNQENGDTPGWDGEPSSAIISAKFPGIFPLICASLLFRKLY